MTEKKRSPRVESRQVRGFVQEALAECECIGDLNFRFPNNFVWQTIEAATEYALWDLSKPRGRTYLSSSVLSLILGVDRVPTDVISYFVHIRRNMDIVPWSQIKDRYYEVSKALDKAGDDMRQIRCALGKLKVGGRYQIDLHAEVTFLATEDREVGDRIVDGNHSLMCAFIERQVKEAGYPNIIFPNGSLLRARPGTKEYQEAMDRYLLRIDQGCEEFSKALEEQAEKRKTLAREAREAQKIVANQLVNETPPEKK